MLKVDEVPPELMLKMEATEEELISKFQAAEPTYTMKMNARQTELNAVLLRLAIAVISQDLITAVRLTQRAKQTHRPDEALQLITVAQNLHESASDEIKAQVDEIEQKVYLDNDVDPKSWDTKKADGSFEDPDFRSPLEGIPLS